MALVGSCVQAANRRTDACIDEKVYEMINLTYYLLHINESSAAVISFFSLTFFYLVNVKTNKSCSIVLCSTDTDTRIGIGKIRIRGYGNFLKKPIHGYILLFFK